MSNIDIGKWNEFRIEELFDIYTGGDLILRDIEIGDKLVISHGGKNNGFGAYVDTIGDRKLFDKDKTLSLSDRGIFISYVQPSDFYIGTRVKALELKEKYKSNKYVLLFLSTIINYESFRFSYGRNATNKLPELIIKLPTTEVNGELEPDLIFMENYMKEIEKDQRELLSNLKSPFISKNSKEIIDTTGWKYFCLDEVFDEIYKGKAHIKQKIETSNFKNEENINFVTRTEKNNGVDCYVSNNSIIKKEAGNSIIIGDTTATIFYQEDDFATGDHIIVCRSKKLNKYNALFLKTILDKERYKYSYGRAFKMESLKNTNILLPAILVNKYYEPDWEYMENFIKEYTLFK